MEQTLVIIKPDAIQRGLSGEIIKRYEQKSLKIVGMKMVQIKEAILREHYAHVVDRPFFKELSQFMGTGPVVVLALEGLNAVEIVRTISGTDNFQLGSIRGDFAVSSQRNLVHSSDSIEAAKEEISRFFEDHELFNYSKNEWKTVYAESDK